MRHFYAEDLDELIIFRSDEFISKRLPSFSKEDIDHWNKYNEDVAIVPYSDLYVFDKPAKEPFFNSAEGYPVDYRVFYRKIEIEGKPFVLMSHIPMIENKDLLATMGSQYGLLFLALLVSLTILQRMMSKKLWKPFYDTLDKIEGFKLESGQKPDFEQTTTIEFSRLNEKLNGLMVDNITIYKQQKEFIENASHELQTPLAVFKSQLDILLQQPGLTQSNTEIIRSLYAVSARMTRLNKNLLFLARIDNSQLSNMEVVDFVKILHDQLLYLRELAESEGLTVHVETGSSLNLKANKLLVESLINNMVVNAIRHNVKEGTINIKVDKSGLKVSNTGVPYALDPNKIFRRFSRSSEEKKGNGLGLAIVQQICIMHGWEVSYNYENNLHIFGVKMFNRGS
ncbi:HAMP domain-containing sensor histidine kinase [Bacteroides graminisolvens]|uniref:sensor histidine kinase n=1 Tax=Bacteroides graminisolvens TaxID=477666 RepID=UPI0029C8456B|nr:HAMP domain-containing sensor histidine kinase [Bacteroides graminisolvens]